jgi:UDP-N-acetylglucosamine acyltransferase
MSVQAHHTAIIHEDAQLAEGVVVGPYAVIDDKVFIGKNCIIDSHAVIKSYVRMGEGNRVHSHALVGGEPQDIKFGGEESWLEIGNNNNIREFATLHRGTAGGGGITKIGDNNLIMAYCHVAHDCRLGSHVIMSNGATLAGHIELGDHVIIGGLSAIHPFCRVGRGAFLGGASGLPQDLPPWMLAAGPRAALVMGPNVIGLRRMGVSGEIISALRDAYKTIWRSKIPRAEALDSLEQKYPDVAEVIELINFIRSSERGICGAPEKDEEEV